MTSKQSFRLFAFVAGSLLALSLASCRPVPDCDLPEFLVTTVIDGRDGDCDEDDDCSLREAIQSANFCAGPDTIRLPAGLYNLVFGGTDEDVSYRGDLDINDDVTIIGEGNPEINANAIDRVFDIAENTDVTMEGLTITGGLAVEGGGIRNKGSLTLSDVEIIGNEEIGIFNVGTSLELVNCTVEANIGTGIDSFKTSSPLVPVSLTNTDITANNGGGIWGVNTELTITGGSISNNQGSGVQNMTYLMMSGTTVSGNNANEDGGGLYLANIQSATIVNSSIYNNHAGGDGGGIFFHGLGMGPGVLTLTNVTVSGNSADRDGGGMIIASDPPSMMELNNVTLSGNQAGRSGQAIYNNGTVNLHNTIIESPGAGNCGGNAAEVVSLGYNISSDGTCLSGGTDDLLSTDPMLEPLADNGGGTLTHALPDDSPAVDSADPANCPATDQRGESRPQRLGCDRGAFELTGLAVLEPEVEPEVAEPLVTPTPIPIRINFNADAYSIPQGECTTLRWQVDYATDVLLEGEAVEAIGARQVCPSKTTIYKMQGTSPGAEQEATVTIEVVAAPEPPAAPTGLSTELVCDTEDVVTINWTDQADNETGYRVYRDGELIATLPANSTSHQDTIKSEYYHVYSVEAYNEAGSSKQISVTQEDNCYM